MKDDDLQISLSHRTLARPEQAEETAQGKVEEGRSRRGIVPHDHMTAFMQTAIEFLDPTAS